MSLQVFGFEVAPAAGLACKASDKEKESPAGSHAHVRVRMRGLLGI